MEENIWKAEPLKEKPLTVTGLREIILDIFNKPYKGREVFKLGVLEYEEAKAYVDLTKEEYENSSKLYWVGNTLTGKEGFENFTNSLNKVSKEFKTLEKPKIKLRIKTKIKKNKKNKRT